MLAHRRSRHHIFWRRKSVLDEPVSLPQSLEHREEGARAVQVKAPGHVAACAHQACGAVLVEHLQTPVVLVVVLVKYGMDIENE